MSFRNVPKVLESEILATNLNLRDGCPTYPKLTSKSYSPQAVNSLRRLLRPAEAFAKGGDSEEHLGGVWFRLHGK